MIRFGRTAGTVTFPVTLVVEFPASANVESSRVELSASALLSTEGKPTANIEKWKTNELHAQKDMYAVVP